MTLPDEREQTKTSLESLIETEESHRIFVETSADAFITIDENSTILFLNPAAARIFGYTLSQMAGQPLTLLMPDYLRHLQRAGVRRNFETDHKQLSWQTVELPGLHQSGREILLELSCAEFSRAGRRFYTCIVRDLTVRQRAEEALRFLVEASEMLASSLDYETTLSNVARLVAPRLADWCVVHVVEEDGRLQQLAAAHADQSRLELLREINRHYPSGLDAAHGYPLVVRTGRAELIPEITDDMLGEVARDEGHLNLLRRLGLKSTLSVPLAARGRMLGAITFASAESGRIYNSADLALAEDLAQRAATAIDNARLYKEAQRANRLKDEFLATLSHELRAPLTPIIGWVHMIRERVLKADECEHGLAIIEKNSQTLTRLINDLLDMSAIMSGKMRIEKRPLRLNAVIEEALETIRPLAETLRISLETKLCDETVAVNGDRTRLVQIFSNILANAVKFSEAKGRVRLWCEIEGSLVRVAVEDAGQGIEPEFLPFVFERFRQADSSRTRTHGGLGIGLALVRSFVEAHEGSVTAESCGLGQGSRFTVSLPRLDAVVADVRQSEALADRGGALEEVSALVVEDSTDTLELLHKALAASGYGVRVCASAAEALSAASARHFDIIVSDIGMPGIDGHELIRRLRLLPHLGLVPAIALSGYAAQSDIDASLAAGFDLHLIKPFDPVILAAEIERLIAGKKAAGDP